MADNRSINFITHIAVDGIFDNPLDVKEFEDCNNKPCFDPDTEEYPMNETMWQYILNSIYDTRFRQWRDDVLDPIPDVNSETRTDRVI